MDFYQLPADVVIKNLNANIRHGLSTLEVKKRLETFGPNALPQPKPPPIIFKFIAQFKNLLVLILVFATIASLLLGDTLDAVAIFAIVMINATIGFAQEVQAEKTLESLKEKEVAYAAVLRAGEIEKIPVRELVPGDILVLEEGDRVGADCRLIEGFALRVDESILTGESLPTGKNATPISSNVPLADRKNMLFKDTSLVAGRGKAVVTATGFHTEVGKIAAALHVTREMKTPLTIELEHVAKMLTVIVAVIATSIFGINIINRISLIESLLVSISLAVAAIPEGMPAVVTIVLSLGVKRLADQKTIVKKLTAVETLGAIKIIATDKTGTLTQNKINVVAIKLPDGKSFRVEGEGYKTTGIYFSQSSKIVNPLAISPLKFLLTASILSSNATLKPESDSVIGDTTEGALLVAAERAGLRVSSIHGAYHKLFEVPFSAERKMMSVLTRRKKTNEYVLFVKGAPEVIGKCANMSRAKNLIYNKGSAMLASKGYRSLAIAYKRVPQEVAERFISRELVDEKGLTVLGLVGMQDTLRKEVKTALLQAVKAGITTIMITGDHKDTAAAIAYEAGICEKNCVVLTDQDIEHIRLSVIAKRIREGVRVFARISPLSKLKIIQAITSIPGTQVAVTGDGVNDAPALKAAHIGVAMGRTGSDVTREVADMVITDDNYATIVTAVREGRVIFANLVKFIRYLISCNISEVLVVTLAVFTRLPLPLLPIQILWINLITDGFPALALGMDPPEFDVMQKPPRDTHQGLLHKKRMIYMLIEGSMIGITALGLFVFSLQRLGYGVAQTMTFTVLAFSQLTHAFNNRSTRQSLFTIGPFGNKYLIAATVISMLLQLFVVQTPWGNSVFKTTPLSTLQWIFVTQVSLIPFVMVEVKKFLRRRLALP